MYFYRKDRNFPKLLHFFYTHVYLYILLFKCSRIFNSIAICIEKE